MNTEGLRRDLATEEGRGALTRQSPIGRLVAAVPALLDEIERKGAEVAALRRQIEAVEAERDAARAALSKAELRERLREVERDEALDALSSVPDVPAARDDEIEQRFLAARREANERYDALGDEPEPSDPSAAACAACDGSCGTCPYVAVTTPEEQQ